MELKRTIDGKNYRYLKMGDNTDRKLLILWGFSSFKENVANLVSRNFEDYQVLVPEYPYHNGFDDVDVEITSVSSLADYMRPLLKEEGFQKFDALGFSLGGLVLMEILKDPGVFQAEKVIVWASPVLGYDGIAELSKLLSQMYIKTSDSRLGNLQQNSLLQKVLLKRGVKLLPPAQFKRYLDIFKSYRFQGLGAGCKHLFIYDPLDLLVPIKNAGYLKSNFGSAGILVEAVRGGGHFGTREGWENSLNLIKKFLF